MIQKKKLIAIGCMSALAICGFASLAATNAFNLATLASRSDRQPYVNEITFTAADFANGSGSIVKDGNTYNYSGVTVDGNVVTLAEGGSLSAAADSGSSTGSGLSGAGFSKVGMTAASAFDVVV